LIYFVVVFNAWRLFVVLFCFFDEPIKHCLYGEADSRCPEEEFHQIHAVPKYIFDVNAFTDADVSLPTLGMIEVNVTTSG